MVGIDKNNKITGIEVISQQETPGLGAKIKESSFLQQFIGKTLEELKIKKDGGKIDAVTGATISSRAVTNGVRQAIEQSMGINQTSESNAEQITNDDSENGLDNEKGFEDDNESDEEEIEEERDEIKEADESEDREDDEEDD